MSAVKEPRGDRPMSKEKQLIYRVAGVVEGRAVHNSVIRGARRGKVLLWRFRVT